MPVTLEFKPIAPCLFAMVNEAQLPALRGRVIAEYTQRAIAEATATNLAVLGAAVATRVIVDGIVGAALAQAQGRVRVEFDVWPPILQFALDVAVQKSPED